MRAHRTPRPVTIAYRCRKGHWHHRPPSVSQFLLTYARQDEDFYRWVTKVDVALLQQTCGEACVLDSQFDYRAAYDDGDSVAVAVKRALAERPSRKRRAS